MEKEQIGSELVISITELRRHFGKYLHLVIEGRTIIVTKYGEKIVKLEPINAPVHHSNKDAEPVAAKKVDEYLKKNDPYSSFPSPQFDLGAYASYVNERNLSTDQITDEILNMFILNGKEADDPETSDSGKQCYNVT